MGTVASVKVATLVVFITFIVTLQSADQSVNDDQELDCTSVNCDGDTVTVKQNARVNIFCNGLNACRDTVFKFRQGSKLWNEPLRCNAENACRGAKFLIRNAKVNGNGYKIKCSDTGSDESCRRMNLTLVGDSTVNLYCGTNQNCIYTKIYLHDTSKLIFGADSSINDNNDKRVQIYQWDQSDVDFVNNLKRGYQVHTAAPTKSPSNPTSAPTKETSSPTIGTSYPTVKTISPTKGTSTPTTAPTAPSMPPTQAPTSTPTRVPSQVPTQFPSDSPSAAPTRAPTAVPSRSPSQSPSLPPTRGPSRAPSKAPSQPPTSSPTSAPTNVEPAVYQLYYNHTGIDYLFVNLEEYRAVMSAAVTSAFKKTLSLKVSDDAESDQRRRLIDSLTSTIGPRTTRLDNGTTVILNSETIDERIAQVSVCAVFTLDLNCEDDPLEEQFDSNYGSKQQKQFGGTVFKAQGTVFYSGDDPRNAVEFSNVLLEVLFERPDETALFRAIGNEMSNSSIGGVFVVGGLVIQRLSLGQAVTKADTFGATVLGFGIVTYLFVGMCLIAAVIAELHSRVNGIEVESLAWVYFAMYTWDFYSDLVFAVRLATLSLWILFIPSMLFILVPFVLSFHQLFNEQKKWVSDCEIKDRVSQWIIKHNSKLVMLSLISGSTFGATELLNSGSFAISLFEMGITEIYMKQMHGKRLYSSVLFENVPQLIIQAIYLSAIEDSIDSEYAIIAMCSSVISLLICAVESYQARALVSAMKSGIDRGTLEVTIGRHRRDESDAFKSALPRLIRRPHGLSASVAQSVAVDPKLVEVIAIYKFEEFLRARFMVFGVEKEQMIERFVNSVVNDSFQYSLKQSWHLSKEVAIHQLSVLTDSNEGEFAVLWTDSERLGSTSDIASVEGITETTRKTILLFADEQRDIELLSRDRVLSESASYSFERELQNVGQHAREYDSSSCSVSVIQGETTL